MIRQTKKHSHIFQQFEEGSDAENDRILKDLGKALKKITLTTEQQRNLNRLGAAIFMGEVSDEDLGEDFRLIGKAILLKKLNGETRLLLSKALLSDAKTAKVYLKKLIYVLKKHGIRHDNLQLPSNYSFRRNGKLKKSGSDADVADLKKLLNKVFKSNENQTTTRFLKNSFKAGVSTDDKYNKTLELLEMALSYDVQKGVEYQRILELFADSVKTGKLIEINNPEILNYIYHVLNAGSPLDIAELVEIHLKDKKLSFNHSDLSAFSTINNQETSQALHTVSVPKNFSINDRNENQISSIANNISPGKPDSATIDQNVKHAIKTTKRAKSKKRSKISSKSKIKSDLESHQSKDKSKKSRKRSSKKTKRSKRITEKSKNNDIKRRKN